jgi:hypothetical protein
MMKPADGKHEEELALMLVAGAGAEGALPTAATATAQLPDLLL